jgi:membrane-associated phospholipid phosphatase
MPSPGRIEAGPARAARRPLAPLWAGRVAVAAALLGGLLAALVWHATKLNRVDAWAYRWQEIAHQHAGRIAEVVSGTEALAVVLAMLACAFVAWRAARCDAILLALAVVPATLAADVLLKQFVRRQWHGSSAFIFPAGHPAVATAAAVAATLVFRVAPVTPRTRLAVALLGGGCVLLVGAARLVKIVHSLTDVVGGVATGIAMAFGLALAITGLIRHRQL